MVLHFCGDLFNMGNITGDGSVNPGSASHISEFKVLWKFITIPYIDGDLFNMGNLIGDGSINLGSASPL